MSLTSKQIDSCIDLAAETEDLNELEGMLACHGYTRDGSDRFLGGFRWKPFTLTVDQIQRIWKAIEDIEDAQW